MSRFHRILLVLGLLIGLGIAVYVLTFSPNKVGQIEEMKSTPTVPPPNSATGSSVPIPIEPAQTAESKEAGLLKGIGILGDSFYDEYQADDQRGGIFHAVTFNLIEILTRTRNFNFGPWGSWGEPRRTGYEYNWARSGATSQDLIDQGQHIGLAQQIQEGKVTYVYIGIGANDFSPYYREDYKMIYSSQMTDQQLSEKIQKAISNLTLAVDTVRHAGAKGIIVTLFTQWELDPLIGQKYPDPARRHRIAKAIDAVNQGILAMAKERDIFVLDQNQLGAKLLPKLEKKRYLNVGGKLIDFLECGDRPVYSRLADCQHVGTALSGVIANMYFIEPLNSQFGLHIPLLSDAEILEISGLGN